MKGSKRPGATIRTLVDHLPGDSVVEWLVAPSPDTVIARAMPVATACPGDVTFYCAASRIPPDTAEQTHATLLLLERGVCLDKARLAESGGQGAVVGMGSVVVTDVRSGAVVIGNPARQRRERR